MVAKTTRPGICGHFQAYFTACKHVHQFPFHNSSSGGIFCNSNCKYTRRALDNDPWLYKCRIDASCIDCNLRSIAKLGNNLGLSFKERQPFVPGRQVSRSKSLRVTELKRFLAPWDFMSGDKRRNKMEKHYTEKNRRSLMFLAAATDDMMLAYASQNQNKPKWGPEGGVRERFVKRKLYRKAKLWTMQAKFILSVREEQIRLLQNDPDIPMTRLPWILMEGFPVFDNRETDLVTVGLMYPEEKCKVCNEETGKGDDPAIILPCEHAFHAECLQCHWMERMDADEVQVYNCPDCKLWYRDVRVVPSGQSMYWEDEEQASVERAERRKKSGETPDLEAESSELSDSSVQESEEEYTASQSSHESKGSDEVEETEDSEIETDNDSDNEPLREDIEGLIEYDSDGEPPSWYEKMEDDLLPFHERVTPVPSPPLKARRSMAGSKRSATANKPKVPIRPRKQDLDAGITTQARKPRPRLFNKATNVEESFMAPLTIDQSPPPSASTRVPGFPTVPNSALHSTFPPNLNALHEQKDASGSGKVGKKHVKRGVGPTPSPETSGFLEFKGYRPRKEKKTKPAQPTVKGHNVSLKRKKLEETSIEVNEDDSASRKWVGGTGRTKKVKQHT